MWWNRIFVRTSGSNWICQECFPGKPSDVLTCCRCLPCPRAAQESRAWGPIRIVCSSPCPASLGSNWWSGSTRCDGTLWGLAVHLSEECSDWHLPDPPFAGLWCGSFGCPSSLGGLDCFAPPHSSWALHAAALNLGFPPPFLLAVWGRARPLPFCCQVALLLPPPRHWACLRVAGHHFRATRPFVWWQLGVMRACGPSLRVRTLTLWVPLWCLFSPF